MWWSGFSLHESIRRHASVWTPESLLSPHAQRVIVHSPGSRGHSLIYFYLFFTIHVCRVSREAK